MIIFFGLDFKIIFLTNDLPNEPVPVACVNSSIVLSEYGDTFGFLDRRIIWDNASSQFTTNTPYSGSIGYNEIAVNIGDNEWGNVTNSIGKYINNNVILDTTFGDIDFEIDSTNNHNIEYISLQRGHIMRLQGTSPPNSYYDAYALGTEKITKISQDEKLRKKIGKKGKAKYIKYFNSTLVSNFIIKRTLDIKDKSYYLWHN